MKWLTRTARPSSGHRAGEAPGREDDGAREGNGAHDGDREPAAEPVVAETREHGPVVRLEQASKEFGALTALEPLDLEVDAGQLFGLVGPSGCGKTTLVRLIVGLLVPTSGDVTVRGVPPASFGVADRREIGYLPQEFSLHPTLTIAENMRFVSSLYGLGWLDRRHRIREVLEFLEIWEARKRLARDASGGQRRRLSLAAALLHRPSLLVVDEPTAGLDPALRARIWEYLDEIQRQGTTIFLTTQYIEEVARCDRMALLHEGRLLAGGTPEDVRRLAGILDTIRLDVENLDQADVQALRTLEDVREVWRVGDEELHVLAEQGDRTVAAVSRTLEQRGRLVRWFQVDHAGYDEVFIRLVDRG